MELWFFISAFYLIRLFICTKFQRVSVLLRGCGLYTEFIQGHNSVKCVGGVMVLVLSTLPANVLFLYQVFTKYLIGFQSCGSDH